MRRMLLVLVLVGLSVGCWVARSDPVVEGRSSAADDGTFALIVRGDTTVLEEYTRTALMLEGLVRPQVEGSKFGWARYRVEFDTSGAPERAELLLGRPGTSPDSPAVARWSVVIGDGVLEEHSPNQPPRRVPVPPGVVPVFAPSMGMHHELLLQARRHTPGQGSVEVPVYPLATDGRVNTVTVSWTARDAAGIAYVDAPGAEFLLDEQGRVLGSRSSEGDFVAVRLR